MPKKVVPLGTSITIGILVAVGFLMYWLSTWSSLNAVKSARRLAAVAARTAGTQQKDDPALQDALLLELSKLEHRNDLAELLLHISIAFFVAVVIVIAVEIHSSRRMETEAEASALRMEKEAAASRERMEEDIRRYRDMIAENVFQALYQRTIPSSVVEEVEQILRSDIVRDKVYYTLTFLRYDGLPQDLIVVRRRVSYNLKNITGREIRGHLIRTRIVNQHSNVSVNVSKSEVVTLPRHTELKVNDLAVDLSKAVKGNLLEHSIDINANGPSPSVVLTAEEPLRLRDSNAYTMMTPCLGLTVRIDNRLDKEITVTKVALQLPKRDFAEQPNGDFSYAGALLPGQTFTVTWDLVPAPLTPTNPQTQENTGVKTLE